MLHLRPSVPYVRGLEKWMQQQKIRSMNYNILFSVVFFSANKQTKKKISNAGGWNNTRMKRNISNSVPFAIALLLTHIFGFRRRLMECTMIHQWLEEKKYSKMINGHRRKNKRNEHFFPCVKRSKNVSLNPKLTHL